jgi:hypothetical protein
MINIKLFVINSVDQLVSEELLDDFQVDDKISLGREGSGQRVEDVYEFVLDLSYRHS